ncbi:MAG: sensor histidine kinase [Acetobacteraceae bacterium]
MAGAEKPHEAGAGSTDWLTLAGRLAALGSIAGEAAHRFNNLRAVIEGTSDLIAAEPAGPRVLPRLERIREAAAGAQALAAVLAGIARSGSPCAIRIDLGAWLTAARPSLMAVLGPSNTLAIEAPATAVSFTCDPNQLRAALTALVLNAASALAPAGHVHIRLEVPTAANELLLTVADDGAGMVPGIAARAREPFYTTRPQAAGLGLTVVEAFASRHRGRLELSSDPGHGTRVSLWLAATEAAGS